MSGIGVITFGLFIFYFYVGIVNTSHFGGGIFTWTPASDGSNITILFRIAWEIRRVPCDGTTVINETLIGLDSMTCFSGCTGTIGSLLFKCTDFKAGAWSSGGNSLILTTGVNQLAFGFSGNAWVDLQEGGGRWYLKATVNLSVRTDIGRINTSPTAAVPPVLYWQNGCTYSYSLSVNDVDGDIIRCRWATSNLECGDVCSAFSGLVVNKSACTIYNSASKNVGYYAVALQVEDFAEKSSTTPLSSIPLQFLVYIYSGTGCPDPPQLISPTPAPDTQYVLDKGDTLSLVIKARGPNIFHRVVTMTTVTRVSEVTSVESSWNYITLNAAWKSSDYGVGQTHRICFYARDTVGVTSDTRCITIVVTDIDECTDDSCENGGTCIDGINDYKCICVPGYTDKNCTTNIDECLANPCDNGGTCTDEINDYTCACIPGYSDKNCSTNIDECIGDPCDNGGTCIDGINDYTCVCVPGYTGKNCSIDIDECMVNPCDNGGTCTDGINEYTCTCVPGYTDKNCSTNIDECRYYSCDNGGTCTDAINDYSCACVPGYTGKNCSIDINECQDDPCENDGTCIDEINDFTCTCVPGYTDKNCSTNINECRSNPCQTGACIDKVNGYLCLCEPGFLGTHCDIDKDECISSPCGNGGTCSDGINGYKCSCAAGYTMANCQTEINECISSPCRNKATCSDELNGYRCFCLEGYTGHNCENELDECISNPCQFGGNCSDRINGYECSCVTGYAGINCETDLDECLSNPCHFGANCSDRINAYECSCLAGYTGTNCETGINSLHEKKPNFTPIIVGAVLGAVVTAVAVFVAYKIYQYRTKTIPKADTAQENQEEKLTEIKEENKFVNKTFEHEIETPEEEINENTQQNKEL